MTQEKLMLVNNECLKEILAICISWYNICFLEEYKRHGKKSSATCAINDADGRMSQNIWRNGLRFWDEYTTSFFLCQEPVFLLTRSQDCEIELERGFA